MSKIPTLFRIVGHVLALSIAFLGLAYASLLVPGTPMNTSLEAMQPLAAGNPTDGQIDRWFSNTGSVVLFTAIVLPLIVALLYSAYIRVASPRGAVVGAATTLVSVGLVLFGADLTSLTGAIIFSLVVALGFSWRRARSHAHRTATT